MEIAKSVLDLLPRELTTIREPEERAMEYMHYRQFFMVWDALERVVECEEIEVTHVNKDSRDAWLEDYKVCFLPKVTFPQEH